MPESVQPGVGFLQRHSVHRVEPSRSLGSDLGEPVFPQDFQVLRHGGLGDREFRTNHVRHRTCGRLPLRQQFQDPTANRVTQDIEGVHTTTLQPRTYISLW